MLIANPQSPYMLLFHSFINAWIDFYLNHHLGPPLVSYECRVEPVSVSKTWKSWYGYGIVSISTLPYISIRVKYQYRIYRYGIDSVRYMFGTAPDQYDTCSVRTGSDTVRVVGYP